MASLDQNLGEVISGERGARHTIGRFGTFKLINFKDMINVIISVKAPGLFDDAYLLTCSQNKWNNRNIIRPNKAQTNQPFS